jgi:hypothetical protein
MYGFIGVQKSMRIVNLPANALLELPAEKQHDEEYCSGFVEALWEGKTFAIFEHDLRTSAFPQGG